METKRIAFISSTALFALLQSFLFFFFLCFSVCLSLSFSYNVEGDNNQHIKSYERIQLTSARGPESLAFDCNGEGPYTGLSDGRVFKWQGPNHGWTEFAFPAQRRRDICDGSNDPTLEHICGRPLGLQFNKVTCDLYIADAYFGLLMVGPNGGEATQLASSAEGVPFRFTNALDVDTEKGVIYFTDSSIWFQRWAYILVILSGDSTGRLMKYDLQNRKVTVLLRDLKFANGVAISKDNTYILIAETTTSRILRYWLRGPKANTCEVFVQLPGHPDNIKRNAKGEFWVAINNGRTTQPNLHAISTQTIESSLMGDVVGLRLDEKGSILEELNGNGGRILESVSEVEENNGSLWIGSVVMPYISISKD